MEKLRSCLLQILGVFQDRSTQIASLNKHRNPRVWPFTMKYAQKLPKYKNCVKPTLGKYLLANKKKDAQLSFTDNCSFLKS